MSIDNNLISTALLAQQQAKKIRFDMNCGEEGDRSGFWFKGYANEDEDDEIMVEVLIYIDVNSVTGYSVQVDVLNDETITIYDKPIASFSDFQAVFASKFIQKVYDAHN